MSLAGSKTAPISIEDSEDESIQENSKSLQPNNTPNLYPSSSSGLHTIGDRIQMERERLERQRKRMLEQDPEEEAYSEVKKSKGSPGPKLAATSSSAQGPAPNRKDEHLEVFWEGAILKSYNVYSTAELGTRFERFLLPTTPFRANGLKHAIMATYCEDIEWISAMFPKGKEAPEITMITLAQEGIKAGAYSPLHPQLVNWVRLVVPRKGLGEYTTMHMKFMLLFYEERLRLLIFSGNFVEYDWTRIENTVFVHDFPRLPEGQEDKSSPYGVQMRRVLGSLSVPPGHQAMRFMPKYEMKSACEARIVASVPTPSPVNGWSSIEQNGIGRLASIAREIFGERRKVTIEAQGSSMGSYSTRWMQQFHLVCQGGDYTATLPLPSGNKAQKAWAQGSGESDKRKWPPVKLLYPSEDWVKSKSVEGVLGAGTFFGKSRQAIDRGFLELMYQPLSLRGNIMMHHKSVLTLETRKDQLDVHQQGTSPDAIIGWVYMGSHNLTQAAWGNISLSKSDGVQMTCSNWELGIVLPVRSQDLQNTQRHSSSLASNIITWKRPVDRYRPKDLPWDQKLMPSI